MLVPLGPDAGRDGFPNPPGRKSKFFGTKSKLKRNEIQGKQEGNPSICLPRIEPFQGLAPTPHDIFCFWAASGFKDATAAWACLLASGCLSLLLVFVSSSSNLSSE
jgi:hypothetical protein